MAKRRVNRKFNLRMVRINAASSIGALGSLDVAVNPVSGAPADKMRFVSVNASYSWTGKASIDDAAAFGLAHSDYTATEIEECLEASTAIDLGDKIAQERSNRLVREIGTISGGEPDSSGEMYNDGKIVKTKLNWLMSSGDTLNLWIRNASGVVYTTGGSITIAGKIWVRD